MNYFVASVSNMPYFISCCYIIEEILRTFFYMLFGRLHNKIFKHRLKLHNTKCLATVQLWPEVDEKRINSCDVCRGAVFTSFLCVCV